MSHLRKRDLTPFLLVLSLCGCGAETPRSPREAVDRADVPGDKQDAVPAPVRAPAMTSSAEKPGGGDPTGAPPPPAVEAPAAGFEADWVPARPRAFDPVVVQEAGSGIWIEAGSGLAPGLELPGIDLGPPP